jgi:SlyX protein
MEKRIMIIESKLAYAEDITNTLNELVIEQGKMIEALQMRIASLEQRFIEYEKEIPNERPPHY